MKLHSFVKKGFLPFLENLWLFQETLFCNVKKKTLYAIFSLRIFCVAGKLPSDYSVAWRGDSALSDGSDVDVDLVGGMYDAGDHIKFSFPLAFTSTLLSWSVLEYSSQFSSVDLLDSTKAHIRWITDYLLKTHNSTDELYFQVCSSCNGNTLLYYYLFLPTPLFPFRSCPIYWLHCVENVLYFGMKIWLLV